MYKRFIKRPIDLILSIAALLLCSWLFLIIAIAILIDDPGKIFFSQKRVGIDKRFFKLYKFRSMKMSTPHDVPTHLLTDPDQYITKVGRFLRRTSLDELPQLFNILKGDMSFIGPRPALWNQDDLVAERDKYGANSVRPGLSGWAQIHGRDELEIPEKARLDGEYVKRMSFLFDCRCFFGTFSSALRAEGVVEGGTGELHRMGSEKPIRVVVLSSHTPSLFWFRLDMMRSFMDNGCEVIACGNEPEDKWASDFLENGITYRQIFVHRNGANPLSDIKTYRSVKRTLKELAPDKVFTFQAKTVIYGGMAARKLRIAEIYPLIAGVGSIFMKKDLKTRLVCSVMKREYRIALKRAPKVFFQNMNDVEFFRANRMIKDQEVVILRGSGVNTEHFSVQPMPERFGFLCISRLIRDKGVVEYLEASKRIKESFPDVRCMLVGPFDTNPSAISPEELKPYIDAGIEYFGEQSDVRPFIAQCSVFVLPSYREGTPKTVLEAMSSGRAIITTDVPGCRETVTDGVNGRLIPAMDVDALFECMSAFIKDPSPIEEMARRGREMAETVFDVEGVDRTICEAMGIVSHKDKDDVEASEGGAE